MRFDVRDTVEPSDIPIAYVEPRKIYSQDVILGYDLTSFVPGNSIPALGYITAGTKRFSGVTELQIKSSFGKIELTDEYFYDQDLKLDLPLWYQHVLKNPVVNKSVQPARYTERNLNGKVQLNALTTNERTIVAFSEKVYKITPAGVRTRHVDYYIDYNKRTLVTRLDGTYTIDIEFDTIIDNINIAQSDRSRYKVIYQKIREEEYLCTIFTESRAPLLVKYFKKDNIKDTIEVTERTNPSTTYHEIAQNVINDTENNNKKIFALVPYENNDFRVLVSQNPNNQNSYKTFSFRSEENVYTKFSLRAPLNRIHQTIWNVVLKGTGYKYNNRETGDTYTFDLPELGSKKLIAKLTETAEYIDKNTFRLKQNPVWEIDRDGKIKGIRAIETATGNEIEVTNVETATKLITIRNDVGRGNSVNIEYRTRNQEVEIANNLNPILDPQQFNYYHLYYIIPKEYLVADSKLSIFYHKIPRYSNGRKLVYNSSDFLQYFNLNQETILEDVSEYLKNTPGNTIAYPIAVFYIETPVDEDFVQMYESRIRGGGLIRETEYCGDWSYWNGETVDIGGRLLIQIKQSLKQSLKERFLAREERCYRSSSPDLTAEEMTLDWIHAAIKKHIRSGFHYELEFIEG